MKFHIFLFTHQIWTLHLVFLWGIRHMDQSLISWFHCWGKVWQKQENSCSKTATGNVLDCGMNPNVWFHTRERILLTGKKNNGDCTIPYPFVVSGVNVAATSPVSFLSFVGAMVDLMTSMQTCMNKLINFIKIIN